MKILAVANAGGHFIQLLRLRPAFGDHQVAYLSSIKDFKELVKESTFFQVPDANRSTKLELVKSLFRVARIVRFYKPDVIITTGAALGLLSVVVGRILGIKTIWVDSMANVERISLSGRLASFFVHQAFTQWSQLSTTKFIYRGNVIS